MSNAPKHETIEATARESALYQAGEAIGLARGTEACATALTTVVGKMREQPDEMTAWLQGAAAEVEALAKLGGRSPRPKAYQARVAALADGLRALGPTLQQRRQLTDDWLMATVGNMQEQAGKQREAVAAALAALPAGPGGKAGGMRRLAVAALQGAASALAGGKRG